MEQKEKVHGVELSKDELENTYGGKSWWEIRAVNGKLVFILHCE